MDSSNDTKKIWLRKAKFAKKQKKLRGDFTAFNSKSVQIWDHFFPLLFPKDSESLIILGQFFENYNCLQGVKNFPVWMFFFFIYPVKAFFNMLDTYYKAQSLLITIY